MRSAKRNYHRGKTTAQPEQSEKGGKRAGRNQTKLDRIRLFITLGSFGQEE